MKKHQVRAAESRNAAYAAHASLAAAVRRGAHRLTIGRLLCRAIRAWRAAARLHSGAYQGQWSRVARWYVAALEHGVIEPGSEVPARLPRGIHSSWPDVPYGVQWLHRANLPHHGCGTAVTLDGAVWHPANGYYVRE